MNNRARGGQPFRLGQGEALVRSTCGSCWHVRASAPTHDVILRLPSQNRDIAGLPFEKQVTLAIDFLDIVMACGLVVVTDDKDLAAASVGSAIRRDALFDTLGCSRPRPSYHRQLEPLCVFPQSRATNSATDIPASRIKPRSNPLSISRWSGIERLIGVPGRVRTIWLPRCRSKTHPARSKTRRASRPLTTGSCGIP